MAWSNQQHAFFNDDMDSSDGNNAKKLRVRNSVAAPAQTHRVEIAERAHPLQPHNALKVNGDTQIDYYGDDNQDHLAGTLAPEPAGLFINSGTPGEFAEDGDPDLSLGWYETPEELRNRVWIRAKQAVIGREANPSDETTPVFLESPVSIQGTEAETIGTVLVEGKVAAKSFDANIYNDSQVLSIGRDAATSIEVAKTAVETHVYGGLRVDENANLDGNLDVLQGAHVHGLLQANGTIQASDLDINGNGDISGDLLVHGVLLSEQHLTAGNTEISANDESQPALSV